MRHSAYSFVFMMFLSAMSQKSAASGGVVQRNIAGVDGWHPAVAVASRRLVMRRTAGGARPEILLDVTWP
jgi:hypothetical protein